MAKRKAPEVGRVDAKKAQKEKPPSPAARARAEKKAAAALARDQKRAALELQRKQRAEQRQAAQTARRLAAAARLAGRASSYPSSAWEARYWEAVRQLHPGITWDNPTREEVYDSVVKLWRVHRWTPEEAAQAVALRCDTFAEPLQAAPVASGGRALTERVKAPGKVARASVLRPARRQEPDLPRGQGGRAALFARLGRCSGDACSHDVEGGACSITARLAVAKKGAQGLEQVPARYCLVEVSRLETSHLPLRGFAANPDYPAGAQERDYGAKVERAKVLEIAKDFDPALIFNTSPGAIDGVPVATEGRVVLGGNGRTMATRLVYAGQGVDPASAPKDYLIDHAAEFGFRPEDVERFQQPMLVRTVRVTGGPRELAAWSRRLNVSLSQDLDPVRLAVSRARFLDDAALRELAGAMDEGETLAAFLGSQRSRRFVSALQAAGVVDARAAATMLQQDGLLSEQGRDLVADLLVAVLVPDAALIQAYGRGPVATLARAAPYLVMAGQDPAWDVRPQLRRAVVDRIAMRSAGTKDVAAHLRQGALFSGEGAAVAGDDAALILLRVLTELEGSPVKLARFSRSYAEQAAANPPGQAALFAREKVQPVEALRLAGELEGVRFP